MLAASLAAAWPSLGSHQPLQSATAGWICHLQGCKDGRQNQASGAWPSHGALQVLESIAIPVNMEDRTALLKAATTYACVLAWRMLHPWLPHCSRLRSVMSG